MNPSKNGNKALKDDQKMKDFPNCNNNFSSVAAYAVTYYSVFSLL